MKTQVLQATRSQDIARAIALLQQGRLVAVPTETVYGLAANARDGRAVARIFEAKGRPSDHPLIVHIGRLDALPLWAIDIPPLAYRLAEAFWPGPLTLLLKKAPDVPEVVTAGKSSIGIRMPAHPVLLSLLRESGLGLAAPSANLYKRLSPTSAEQVLGSLGGRIDAVLDGGDCEVGLESTILDMTGDVLQVLRSGPITASALARAAGEEVLTPAHHNVAVPGNVAVHYQPRTPLFIADRAEVLTNYALNPETTACVLYGHVAGMPVSPAVIYLPEEKAAYARLLYRTLHQLDALGADAIWLERPPIGETWNDVNDRLSRAASSP